MVGSSVRAEAIASFLVLIMMAGAAAPVAAGGLPSVENQLASIASPPRDSATGRADTSDQQAADGAVNQTVIEQGFSNVQIVWTNIGFGAPLSVEEGDATGDGHPELAIGTESGVMLADKHFPTIYWETKLFEPVALVTLQDMNGELPLDVAALTMAGHVLGLNGADGTILWEGQVGPIQAAHLADVSGDKVNDIVVAGSAGTVSALDGKTGTVLWQQATSQASQLFAVNRVQSRGLVASATGDVSGDGVPDLVVVDRTHFGGIGVPYGSTFANAYAYDGASGRLLWTHALHGMELGAHMLVRSVAIGDVNADASSDVVIGGEYSNGAVKEYLNTYCPLTTCIGQQLPPEVPKFLGGFVTALDGSLAAGGETPVHQVAVRELWTHYLNGNRVAAVGFAGAGLLVGTVGGDVMPFADGAPVGTALNVSHEHHKALIKEIRSLPKGDALVITDYFFVRVTGTGQAKATFDPPGAFAPVSISVVGDEVSLLAAVEDARVYHLTPDFKIEKTTKTYGKGTTFTTADFTGDGVPDLVAGSLDGDVYLLNGRSGRRLLNGTATGAILGDIGLGRINGDSKPDVLVATKNGDVRAFDGRDLRTLWTAYAGGDAVTARPGDLTADGVTDMAVLLRDGTVAVVSGTDGEIAWTYADAESEAKAIAIGDFDSDAKDDLAVGHERDGAILALAGPTGKPLWTANGGQPVKALRGADLNGDGRDEIVAVVDRASSGGNPQVRAFDKGAALWKVPVAEGGYVRSLGLATSRIDATSKGDDVLVCLSAEAYSDPSVRRTGPQPPPVHVAFGIHGEAGHLFWRAVLPEACGPVAIGDLNKDGWSEAILSYGPGIAALNGKTGELVMSYATNGRNRELLSVRLNADKVPELLLASEDANMYALAFSDGALFGDGGDGANPAKVKADDFFGPAKRKKGGLPGFEVAGVLAAAAVALFLLRRQAL